MSVAGQQWITAFWAQATQLDGIEESLGWYAAGVTAEDAAAWANLGFKPDEAAPHIAAGITPQTYREMEDHAEAQAGGPEALAAMRVAELLGTGALLGPDAVIVVQDPMDPHREIIALREDLDD